MTSELEVPVPGRHRRPGRLCDSLTAHRRRASAFGLIGLFALVAGISVQWALVRIAGTSGSYAVQAVFSIELSYVLNRRITWGDRPVPVTSSWLKWNVQRFLLTIPNYIGYALLLRFGLPWLAANLAVTAVFTALNYVAGDWWSFARRTATAVPEATAAALPETSADTLAPDWVPTVSIVIPCKGNERTIRPTVEALLAQDYQELAEVIVVGDVGDSTWTALEQAPDPRLVIIEQAMEPGFRDPNIKRDTGLRKATGEVLALADSDIVMDSGWLSRAIMLLREQGTGLVAGGMRSIHDSFWGRFVDGNVLAAKTPRLPRPYPVTAANFGQRGYKPPICANAVFTRDLYERTPLDVTWFYGYEDYEWFWRVARAGHKILFCGSLTAAHHHRRSFRKLLQEYRRSAEGCARFARMHSDCPLARKRILQAALLPLALLGTAAGAGWALAAGYGAPAAAGIGAGCSALAAREVVRTRRLEAIAYPFIGVALAAAFALSLSARLLLQHKDAVVATDNAPPLWDAPPIPARRGWLMPLRRLSWPLTTILAVQAAFSLSLVWSNTAFADEANYLWQGRQEWAHWLHGSALPLPVLPDSGIPQIYPPIGALAAYAGGLGGARILSMCFMLIGTVLVYLIAKNLFDTRTAVMGAGMWAVSEPVLRLSFATYDPMACMLVLLAAWLAIQAGTRRRRGEFVALSAAVLALASGTAFSFAIMIPVVVVIAFFAWVNMIGIRQAIWCASWLLGASLALTLALLTFSHSWKNVIGSTITRSGSSVSLGYSVSAVARSAWSWDGLIFALAAAGVTTAFAFERSWSRQLLVLSLAGAGLIVAAYQAHLGTGWSLDKHMSAGTGFMAIAAGYTFSRINLSAWKNAATACAAVSILSFPAITGLWYARSTFHSWPSTANLISFLRDEPQISREPDLVTGQSQAAFSAVQFYLPSLPVVEASSPSGIKSARYPRVVLALTASLNSVHLSRDVASGQPHLSNEILKLTAGNQGEYPLTVALEHNPSYRIVAAIPYATTISSDSTGLFVVWQRIGSAK